MEEKNNIHIFLASNDKYAPFVATAIASICYNTKSFIEFYIFDGGITNFRKRQIESLKEKFDNFSINFIEIDFNIFSNFKTTDCFSLDMYSRILIPKIKPSINRAIYLDVDTIVLDDIKKLYEENLNNYIIGAVQEKFLFEEKLRIKRNCGIDEKHKYFFSGVLLIDCDGWRKEHATDKILNLAKNAGIMNRIIYPDQDLLNKYFENNYKELDFRYNLTTSQIAFRDDLNDNEQKNLDDAIQNVCIKHFEGKNKPWITNTSYNIKTPYFEEFWFFAKMTNFYEGLLNNFIIHNSQQNTNIIKKKIYKIFNILPFIKIKIRNDESKIYLFNFIPLLTIKSK